MYRIFIPRYFFYVFMVGQAAFFLYFTHVLRNSHAEEQTGDTLELGSKMAGASKNVPRDQAPAYHEAPQAPKDKPQDPDPDAQVPKEAPRASSCPRHYLFHHGRRCPPTSDPDFVGVSSPVYAHGYSAYMDTLGKIPYVKVIFYCVFPTQPYPTFECDLKFEEMEDYVGVNNTHVSVANDAYDVDENGRLINNILLMCPYPKAMQTPLQTQKQSQTQRRVTSVRVRASATVLMTLPVEELEKPAKRKSLALCLPRVYQKPYCKDCVGMNYTYHLPEWIEMQKLMGVDTIFAYNQSMSADASKIFTYYAEQGFVEILSHKPIHNESYMPTSLGVTECLNRNKYAYDYVIIIDMDEFIFGQKFETYQDMLAKYMDHTHKVQVSFSTAFFYTNNRKPVAEDYLLTMSFREYQYLPGDHSGKSITNPRGCHNIVVPHECYFVKKATVLVDIEDAMVHHYKGCSRKALDGRQLCEQDFLKTWPTTNVTEKYHVRLREAVQKTFRDLKLWGF